MIDGNEFIVILFLGSLSLWAIGFGIGCILKMLNE